MAELALTTDSVLVKLLADSAGAVVSGHPEALLAVSERFAARSLWWFAAQSAVDAARILNERGGSRAAAAAARMAVQYANQCEGPIVPRVDESTGPVRLTKREREIAALASGGASSKEIAEQLFLSSRTVESHLHNVFVKLGISDRAALAAALSPANSPV
jgi:DNA-binding NarL/FixJ family response regulator